MRASRLLVLMLLSACWPALAQQGVPVKLPPYEPGQYVHVAPELDALMSDASINAELKKVILRGRDIFMNTQQFRGKYVFNGMDCKSCHLGEGALNWGGPVWPAVTTLPDFRGKNQHVNSLEERIAGCFAFSMNGKPPEYGSDDMLALVAYHQWLATGAKVYERNIGGRGFSSLGSKMPEGTSYQRGEQTFREHCALCHGVDGAGRQQDGKIIFPALWGDDSFNWGAGLARVETAAAFIHDNMPLGKPGSLTVQQAWDLALFVNSHERPQDPRYTGDAKATRKLYQNFHNGTLYGTEVNGHVLGQHDNTGSKPFLKPDVLRDRSFE
ncbi:MAG TPA: c-type cytochrome [Candidatus Acidoferrum sp.]|nr:c-type cytochrome [Candidatus Acidoferrum sp.]